MEQERSVILEGSSIPYYYWHYSMLSNAFILKIVRIVQRNDTSIRHDGPVLSYETTRLLSQPPNGI